MITLFRSRKIVALVMVLFGTEVYVLAASPAPGVERFYIGDYGTSIYVSTLNLTNKFGTASATGAQSSPSFLALTPDHRFLYAVNENGSTVVAYSVNPTNGNLTFLNLLSSQGGGTPAFITVDRSGSNVLAANYNGNDATNGGSVIVFPIRTNGFLGTATAFIQDPGISHAHCIAIDGSNHFVLVADLGLDQVRCLVFNPAAGTLTTNTTLITSVPAGSGPRHITFDPLYQRAYLICQNNSTIIGFNFDSVNGILTPFQTNSTVTNGFPPGANQTAEIAVHPSGRFLYGSNRGYDSVVVYTINPTNGLFTQVQQQFTDPTPRNFAIDPTGLYCIVGSQGNSTTKLYSIDQQTGKLTYANQVIASIPSPSCVVPFIFQPPQPVLSLLSAPTNGLALSISNSLSMFTYQLYESPTLASSGSTWNLVATGGPGQTNFVLSNSLPGEFFRVGVLTNY